MLQLIAFASTPLGQAVLTIAGYLIAKRFPIAQRLIWAVLDIFRVPHPDRQPPGPQPLPAPDKLDNQPSGPAAVDARPVRDLIRDLVGLLTARGQFGQAAAMLQLAPELDRNGDGIPDSQQQARRLS